MKRLATLFTILTILALATGGASARPIDRGCVVEFRAVRGFNEPVPGLVVMVDFDYESYVTSTDWTRFTIPADGYRHGVNVLVPDVGIVWGASLTCTAGGAMRLEAPIG